MCPPDAHPPTPAAFKRSLNKIDISSFPSEVLKVMVIKKPTERARGMVEHRTVNTDDNYKKVPIEVIEVKTTIMTLKKIQ